MRVKKFTVIGVIFVIIASWLLSEINPKMYSMPDGIISLAPLAVVLIILLLGIFYLLYGFKGRINKESTKSFIWLMVTLVGIIATFFFLLAGWTNKSMYLLGIMSGWLSAISLFVHIFYLIKAFIFKDYNDSSKKG